MGERRGQIPNDPLKGLRISDVSFSPDSIVADQIETKKMEGGKLTDLSIQILQEVTSSTLTGDELSWSGEIRIYEGFLNRETASLKQGLSWLAVACNSFYRDRVLTAEERYFQGIRPIEEVYKKIKAAVGPKSFLVRLGWGSGLDSISLNLRKQQPRLVKTRKLIDGRIPMGWLKIQYQ